MHKLNLVFLALALFPSASSAQAIAPSISAKRPMTFADMMAMKRLGETAVSRDGRWLAYSVTTVNLDQNTKTMQLWLERTEGGEPVRLAAAEPGDSSPQFDPGGKRILFVSGRDGGSQLWLADFDPATGATGSPRKLTALATGADAAMWSPDGHMVVFTSAVYPDCPVIIETDFASGNQCNRERDAALEQSKVKAQIFTHLLYRHWNHFTGDKRSHLFLVSVESGAMRDLTPQDSHDVPPFSVENSNCGCAFSPDAKELAFTENLDPEPAISVSASIFTLDLTRAGATPMKVSTSAGGNFSPAYSPDGRSLAWRSQARAGDESDKFRLMVYQRASHNVRDLLPRFDTWVDEFAWATDSKSILFTSGVAGEGPIFSVDAATGEGPHQIATGAQFSGLSPLSDGRTVIASGMRVDQPGEVFRIRTERADEPPHSGADAATEVAPLTHLNDAILAQLELPKMESFWFSAADRVRVEGFLLRPPGFDPGRKYPVKFLIHGGPEGEWGDSWSYRWNAELFAANGYVVVMINPRGSTGYGQTFVDGVNGDWGGKPFTDLMTGLSYAEEHFAFLDRNRECALGASYGGYMANWILGHTNRFRCIVSHDGMFNAESAFASTEEDWFNIWEFRGHPWDYYSRPDSDNPFRRWSPSLAATSFHTPTLVIHGQLDYRLDVSEGFQLFDTLQLLHVPSKMLYFPDEGHWVLKPQNARLWYQTVNGWVDQWTASPGR